jgi:hypothetical protein
MQMVKMRAYQEDRLRINPPSPAGRDSRLINMQTYTCWYRYAHCSGNYEAGFTGGFLMSCEEIAYTECLVRDMIP